MIEPHIEYAYNDGTSHGVGAIHVRRPSDRNKALCGYTPIYIPASKDETPHCRKCTRLVDMVAP